MPNTFPEASRGPGCPSVSPTYLLAGIQTSPLFVRSPARFALLDSPPPWGPARTPAGPGTLPLLFSRIPPSVFAAQAVHSARLGSAAIARWNNRTTPALPPPQASIVG